MDVQDLYTQTIKHHWEKEKPKGMERHEQSPVKTPGVAVTVFFDGNWQANVKEYKELQRARNRQGDIEE